MVHFYASRIGDKPVQIYAGRDKFENEELIRNAWPNDVWFHVDKVSSPHIYVRVPEDMPWESLAGTEVATDAAQLVKAGSIEGNKRDNVVIIFCPASNLKKTGDMDVGTVSFKSDKLVRRIHVAKRDNAIVNRLKKTLQIREVDYEAERLERQRAKDKASRAAATERKTADLELARQRAAEKESRSYASLHSEEAIAEATAASRAKASGGDGESDDDFW